MTMVKNHNAYNSMCPLLEITVRNYSTRPNVPGPAVCGSTLVGLRSGLPQNARAVPESQTPQLAEACLIP